MITSYILLLLSSSCAFILLIFPLVPLILVLQLWSLPRILKTYNFVGTIYEQSKAIYKGKGTIMNKSCKSSKFCDSVEVATILLLLLVALI